jgi:hypothetical protein
VIDWTTASSLATAAGTLVLAAATFASVRSANRAARVSERALLAGLRPVLMPSRWQDPAEKVGFFDDHWIKVQGGRAAAEATDDVIYLVIPLRNAGTGLAVLDRWDIYPERVLSPDFRDPSGYHRLTRDLYLSAGDIGFWQGALRDPDLPEFTAVKSAIERRMPLTVDLLYGDHEGGQRTITRFGILPAEDGSWISVASRHWNLDRNDPR